MQTPGHLELIAGLGPGDRALHPSLRRCAVHAVDCGAFAGRPSHGQPKGQQFVAAWKGTKRRLRSQAASEKDLIVIATRT